MLSPWSEYNQRRMADVTDHHFSTMKCEGKPRHPKLVGAFAAIAERSNALFGNQRQLQIPAARFLLIDRVT